MTFYPSTSAAATVISFANPLTVATGNHRMAAPATAAPLVLSKALSGHTDGGELTVYIPVGCTSLYIAPELNVRGAFNIDPDTFLVSPFDAALRHQVELTCSGTVIEGCMVELAAADVTAPTVSTASCSGSNLDALLVTFTEPVYLSATTGLTLSFSVGTARTITAIESGNGTTAILFTLSGNLAGTDVFSFVIGSTRVVCDYSGNLAATGTTSVTNGIASNFRDTAVAAGCQHVFAPNTIDPQSAGAMTSWPSAGSDLVTLAVGGTVSVVSDGGLFVAGVTGSSGSNYLEVSASIGTGDYQIMGRFKVSAVPANSAVFNFGKTGVVDWIALLMPSGGASAAYYDANGALDPTVSLTIGAGWHTFNLKRVGTTETLTIDNLTPDTATVSAGAPSTFDRLTLMELHYDATRTNQLSDGRISHLAIKYNGTLAGADETAMYDILLAGTL